jgi:poly(hydroxyalkanoate) depolymerase family esterase
LNRSIQALCTAVIALTAASGNAHAQVAPASRMTRTTFTLDSTRSRAFLAFRPATYPAQADDRSLVVMLHGCNQSADDFARDTRMNAQASTMGFLVIYPEQAASAQPQRCWNWYLPNQSTRGNGEVALLAALIDSVAFADGVSEQHISIVGMAAGASMAADLGVAYSERYAALALHSGIPAHLVTDAMGVLAASRYGTADADALGKSTLSTMGPRAHALAVIALHGAADSVVAPKNLETTARQWRIVSARASSAGALVEDHLLPGVGHAWSGGLADGTFTAPDGPDATKMIVEFLHRAGAITTLR